MRLIYRLDAHALKDASEALALAIGVLIAPKDIVEETADRGIGVVSGPSGIESDIPVDGDRI
jgi:hypothetical protein